MKKKIIAIAAAAVATLGLAACSDADIASHNLSKDADNFKIQRQVTFYNGITGDAILQIEGRCSIGGGDKDNEVSVTCKVGEDQYKKHFLGTSDNVTWFAQQLEPAAVSKDHYKVVWKPSTIVPDLEVR